MTNGSIPGMTERQRLRFLLQLCDDGLQVLGYRAVFLRIDENRVSNDARQNIEVFWLVVGVSVQGHEVEARRIDHAAGVAIGLGSRYFLEPDGAARTRFIHDHKSRTGQALLGKSSDQPCHDVCPTTWRIGYDHLDGALAGPCRMRGGRYCQHTGSHQAI